MINLADIRGIRWPFKFVGGRVQVSSGENHLKESVRQIIGIGKGEYIMKPQLYSELHQRVFDPINVTALISGDIKESLNRYENRIHSVKVGTDKSKQDQGISGISVSFVIKGRSVVTQIPNINIRTN